ncbi:hypothetical protein HDV00_008076 [Rhizophlyctis rosea]|nr:hypothetical protein HDV00_008076 [Rhizophlyctis rosea]
MSRQAGTKYHPATSSPLSHSDFSMHLTGDMIDNFDNSPPPETLPPAAPPDPPKKHSSDSEFHEILRSEIHSPHVAAAIFNNPPVLNKAINAGLCTRKRTFWQPTSHQVVPVAAEFLNSLDEEVAIWVIGVDSTVKGGDGPGLFEVALDCYIRDEVKERYLGWCGRLGGEDVMGKGAHSEGIMAYVEKLVTWVKEGSLFERNGGKPPAYQESEKDR